MAKLYFRYGTVGSAKTLNLLAVAHSYRQQHKGILLLKPAIDTRFGVHNIRSRAGLEMQADYLLTATSVFIHAGMPLTTHEGFVPLSEDCIDLDRHRDIKCLLLDEAQFLSVSVIEQLYRLTIKADIPVIAYGLKTNFQAQLFSGSKRLLELADSIEEIKTTCHYCNSKATFNIRYHNMLPVFGGPEIQLGSDETYKPICKYCADRLQHQSLPSVPGGKLLAHNTLL